MKLYVIIGAGPGMGLATAERFASEGYRVVLGSRSLANAQALADQLSAKGYVAEAKKVDGGDAESVASFISCLHRAYRGIDVLHYNAAAMRQACIFKQPRNSFNADLAVNVGGALSAVSAAAPNMVARGEGSILVTGGGFAFDPPPDFISLGVGKAALRGLVKGLFEDFKTKGVHIATVTVAKLVSPNSRDAEAVAHQFWKLHAEPRDRWSWEVQYA